MFNIIIAILFCALGAFLYRWRGSPGMEIFKPPVRWFYDLVEENRIFQPVWLDKYWPGPPRPTKQVAYVFPMALIVYFITGDTIFAIVAGIVSCMFVAAGHGAHMDLGHTENPASDQLDENTIKWLLEPIAKWRGWKKNSFIYDATGLTINGVFITLPFAVSFAHHDQWVLAIAAIVSGATKTIAYYIGWHQSTWGATEVGEWLTGAFQYSGFAFIMWLL